MNTRSPVGAPPNSDARVVERYCEAWLAGDAMTVFSLYHDDLTLIWPGDNHLAGTHSGQQASVEALLALQAITNRQPLEVLDVLVGRSAVMVVVLERWTDSDGHSIELRRGLEYTVSDGKLKTCRIYETAQAEVDNWINSNSVGMPK